MRLILLGLLLALLPTAALSQMGVPPVEITDPGPTGSRITENGLLGNYYPAPGKGRHPGLLLLGGSEGGLGSGTTRAARALQAAGFSVFQLSYFRSPGQPQALARIPLEGFEQALSWLERQPAVDPKRLGLVGGSKGAEAVLLLATREGQVKAVVAGMPSSVAWPGFSWTGPAEGSSWTEGGKDVPALAYGAFAPPNISSVYENGLKRLSDHPEAAIPIERSKAHVLLICGEADTLWPSCPMAEQLRARSPRTVAVLAYPNAGHAVFGPPVAPDARGYATLAALGGTVEGNAAARVDGWPKVIAFLQRELGH
jgi:dienelactone hydrolase